MNARGMQCCPLLDLECKLYVQARLPEIDELEKQIKATNEELADLQDQHKTTTEAAIAKDASLTEQITKLQTEVGMLYLSNLIPTYWLTATCGTLF